MSFIQATATSTARSNTGQFIAQRVTPAVVAGVTAFNDLLFETTQQECPVRSGELLASGQKVVEVQARRVVGHVFYTAPHAMYVEMGTGIRGSESEWAGPYSYSPTWPGMAANGFMRRSLDIVRQEGKALFSSQVAAEMKL